MNNLYPNRNVVFDPIKHTYHLGVDELLGVTSLMKKHGLSPDYSAIDPETLANAARLGTMAHQAIEDYVDGLPVENTPLIKSFNRLGLKVVETELLVSDEKLIASSIDLVAETDKDGEVDLIDMKRTSSIHKNALAWQLGIYRYLLERQCPDIKVRKCFCLLIKKGNTEDISKDVVDKLVEIKPVSNAEVIALLQCEAEGTIYSPIDFGTLDADIAISEEKRITLAEGYRMIATMDREMKAIKEKISVIEAELYNYMLAEGIGEMNLDGIKIILAKPYSTMRFSPTWFKQDHLDLYEAYKRPSETKGYIKYELPDDER